MVAAGIVLTYPSDLSYPNIQMVRVNSLFHKAFEFLLLSPIERQGHTFHSYTSQHFNHGSSMNNTKDC